MLAVPEGSVRRPDAPERVQEFDLRFARPDGEGEYRVARKCDGELYHHPPCPAWRRGMECAHLRRAIRLTEEPLTELPARVTDLLWAMDTAVAKGDEPDLERHVRQLGAECRDAVARAQERRAWREREARRARLTPAERSAEAIARHSGGLGR